MPSSSTRKTAKQAGTRTASAAPASPPWERENPRSAKGETHQALSPSAKASAKRHAKAAGRPYPNLVDNMRAARCAKAKAS